MAWYIVLAVIALALIYIFYNYARIRRLDEGTEEMAQMARPWTSMQIAEECRATYFKYYDLLKAFYWFSNPIVIKAALNLLGLPAGGLREPYQPLMGKKLEELKALLDAYGVTAKYGVH